MRYAHEFRDPKLAAGILARLRATVARTAATRDAPLHIMEVCGGRWRPCGGIRPDWTRP